MLSVRFRDRPRMHKELSEYIAARLPACSLDELRVIEYVLAGLEHGRAEYGPLDLASDERDWLRERAMECRDLLFYTAAHAVAEQRRRYPPAVLLRCQCGPEETCSMCGGNRE